MIILNLAIIKTVIIWMKMAEDLNIQGGRMPTSGPLSQDRIDAFVTWIQTL